MLLGLLDLSAQNYPSSSLKEETVIGIDNHNDYYDPALKEARLARHLNHENYTHLRIDISDREAIEKVFAEYQPQRVVNLAAQAGVRYSIENPHSYIQSNIVGFVNILEGCRNNEVEHLVYASTSKCLRRKHIHTLFRT